ncbi:hypothetical protein GCM10025795_41140 [Verticiella sediminum]
MSGSLPVVLALAALAAAPPSVSAAEPAEPDWQAGCDKADAGSACAQAFSEGLAAVRVGRLGGDAGRWGFVDPDGRMVIEPRYLAVASFRLGLAAAQSEDGWGYIDRTGQWIIEPRLRRATSFNAQGTAVVEDGEGRLQLIGRDGKFTRALPRGAMLAGEGFGVGDVAGLRVPSTPLVWQERSYRRLRLPVGVGAVEAVGSGWALVRPERTGSTWGYARYDGTWEVAPGELDSDRAPIRDGEVIALHGPDGWRFAGLDGEALDDAVYAELRHPLPGLWLAQSAKGAWRVLDVQRRPGPELGRSLELIGEGNWRVASTESGAWLLGPWGQVRVLSEAPLQAKSVDRRVWLFATDAQGGQALRQVVDLRDGRRLLDAATAQALARRDVQVLESAADAAPTGDTPAVLALVAGQTPDAAPSVLNAEGALAPVGGAASLKPAGDAGWAQGVSEDGLTGLVDGHGAWRVEPVYTSVGAFIDGLALARLPADEGEGEAGRTVALTVGGERIDVPTRIFEQAERLTGGYILYAERTEGDKRYGIWDVRAGRAVLEPSLTGIESFRDGYALAREADAWGVLDTAGHWRIAPGTMGDSRPRHLGGALFLAPVAGDGEQPRYRLYSAVAGNALEETLSREPEATGPGRWLLRLSAGGVVVVDGERHILLRESRIPRRVRTLGDWLVLDFEDRYGAIDGQGEWRIPPTLPGPLNFVAPLNLASVFGDGRHILVDLNGAPQLPDRPGAQPIPGMARLAWSRGPDGGTQLLAPDGTSVATFEQPQVLDPGSAGDGWVAYREGARAGFMDADGKRVTGPHFDRLGVWREGRAYAQRRDVSGSLLGYIDAQGHYAIRPRFDWAQPFFEARAWVIEGGGLALIDRDGNVVLRSLAECGQRVLLGAADEPRWPTERLACQTNPSSSAKTNP